MDPEGVWMSQAARNLTDCDDGFLRGSRYLIHDRDPLFTRGFGAILNSSGVQPVKLPIRSPNLNAYAENYHHERNHQGIENQPIARPNDESKLRDPSAKRETERTPSSAAQVIGRPRGGGLHHRYEWQRAA